jgi:Flp pilus assembly protein TadG
MKRSPHSHEDSGLATVEFAIVGSLLCLLVFAIISVGIFINAHMQAADTARFEARAAALACSPADITAGTIVTKTATKAYAWFVPFIPYPGDAEETVSYRCGA